LRFSCKHYIITVSNNYLHCSGETTIACIKLQGYNSDSPIRLINNSANVTNTNPQSSSIYIGDGTSNLEVKNNIFSNSGGGYAAFLQTLPANSSWDFNNYHSPTNKIGSLTGTTYTTLPSWAAAINGEANGKNLNPLFANDTSFKTHQRGLNGAGIPVSGVLFDIEGKIRNSQAPDIGAWEFMVDFGITQVLSPTLACQHGTQDSLTVWVRQFGDIPFTNIRLAYRINNGPVTYDTIVGTIYNDMIYTFKQPVNISTQGNYTIKCWLVNNSDDNVNNDTITVQRYSYPAPQVDFTVPNPCQGKSVQFNGLASIIPPYTIASYFWRFDDGDTAHTQQPRHVYQSAGNHPVLFRGFSNMGCYSDTTKMVSVDSAITVSASIQTFVTNVCAGDSAHFLALVINGGAQPVFHWMVNGVIRETGDAQFGYIPENEDAIVCRVISNHGCTVEDSVVSNTIPMTVNALLPVFATASAANTVICEGSTAHLNVTVVNGGLSPTYLWYRNGFSVSGATNATFTVIPANNDQFSCKVTSSEVCKSGSPAMSNAVTITVNPILQAGVTISSSANNLCAGTQVIFTATPVNGGASPSFQWNKGGVSINGATNSTYSYTPSNGDVITCMLNSNVACASGNPALSNAISMTVNQILPVSVTIAASANPVCSGDQVNITANGVNGGNNPVYEWLVNGAVVQSGNSVQLTYIPAEGDSIRCRMTSGLGCVTGNPALSSLVVITLSPLPAPVLSGPATACVNSFGNQYVTQPGKSNYIWNVTGGVITAGGAISSNTATITWLATGNQSVSVNYNNELGCDAAAPAIFPVTVTPGSAPGQAGAISGPSYVVWNTTRVFTVPPIANATGYNWQLPPGAVLMSGANTNTISVMFPQSTATNGTITVYGTNGCGNGPVSAGLMVTVGPVVPVSFSLETLNLTAGQNRCYNALYIIYVAGEGFNVNVFSGASLNLISGGRIFIRPGTRAYPGSYLHAWITTTQQYCASLPPAMMAVATGEEEIPMILDEQHMLRVYPNPTRGEITLDIQGLPSGEQGMIEIYNLLGERILPSRWVGDGTYQLSLAGQPTGVYMLRLLTSRGSEVFRIVCIGNSAR
jgi:hypothetical protein